MPTQLDLDDLNVENAYFRSFDAIVRRQLDPVWHKVGPRTKQLVNDLATLRRLLTYASHTSNYIVISNQNLAPKISSHLRRPCVPRLP